MPRKSKAKFAIVPLQGETELEKLTHKQREFIFHFAKSQNRIEAARKAGYASPADESIRLMDNPQIRAEIERIMRRSNERLGVDVDYIKAKLVDTIENCSQLIPVADDEGQPLMTENADGEAVPIKKMMDAGAVLRAVEILGKHVDVQAFKEQKDVNINMTSDDRVAQLMDSLKSLVGEIKPKPVQLIDAEYEVKDDGHQD